jgi:CDP-diglyceride synthetase
VSDILHDVTIFNVLINIGACCAIFALNVYAAWRVQRLPGSISALYALTGLLWLLRYILFFYDYDSLGIAYTNPVLLMMFTLTLTALLIASIVRMQQAGGFDLLRRDLAGLSWKSKKS